MYRNPHRPKIRRGPWHYLLWMLGYYHDRKALPKQPDDFVFPNAAAACDLTLPWARWLGHATFLVTGGGHTVLFDPIFSHRCSPVPFLGPKRQVPPPLSIEELPRLDAVVITHNHYDHCDLPTIRKLSSLLPHLQWVVPRGLAPMIPAHHVTELGWWEEVSFHGLTITATPSQHFSGRSLLDANRSLWMGALLTFESGKQCYYSGDTGYNPFDFKRIGEKYSSIDLAILPIGTYRPRRFMSPVHLHPEDAVKIHQEMGSKLSVGSHWGTYCLSEEPLKRPPYDLFLALKDAGISCKEFRVLDHGQALNW